MLLLFAASILLLVTTISAPVVNDIGLLRVTLTNRSSIRNSSVSFGSFGYCILDVALAAWVLTPPRAQIIANPAIGLTRTGAPTATSDTLPTMSWLA